MIGTQKPGLTSSETLNGKLRDEAIVRIARLIDAHPRTSKLATTLEAWYAWSDRAQARYLSEIDRLGPTKARAQLRRIVNEVALIGASR